MIVAPANPGEQNPAYRPSSTRVLLSNSYGHNFLGQADVAEACRNKAPSSKAPEVELADCACLLFVGHQRVERRVGDVRMSERGLYEPKVLGGPQKSGGEGVPETMRRAAGDISNFAPTCRHSFYVPPVRVMSRIVREQERLPLEVGMGDGVGLHELGEPTVHLHHLDLGALHEHADRGRRVAN